MYKSADCVNREQRQQLHQRKPTHDENVVQRVSSRLRVAVRAPIFIIIRGKPFRPRTRSLVNHPQVRNRRRGRQCARSSLQQTHQKEQSTVVRARQPRRHTAEQEKSVTKSWRDVVAKAETHQPHPPSATHQPRRSQTFRRAPSGKAALNIIYIIVGLGAEVWRFPLFFHSKHHKPFLSQASHGVGWVAEA
jgi:hypothetical protein